MSRRPRNDLAKASSVAMVADWGLFLFTVSKYLFVCSLRDRYSELCDGPGWKFSEGEAGQLPSDVRCGVWGSGVAELIRSALHQLSGRLDEEDDR